MKIRFQRPKLGQKGQTSIEYILMIVVLATVSSSVFARLKAYLIDNPDSYLNSLIGSVSSSFNDGSLNGAYKFFTLL